MSSIILNFSCPDSSLLPALVLPLPRPVVQVEEEEAGGHQAEEGRLQDQVLLGLLRQGGPPVPLVLLPGLRGLRGLHRLALTVHDHALVGKLIEGQTNHIRVEKYRTYLNADSLMA